MPITSAIDRMPAGRRDINMERISRHCLPIRGRKNIAGPLNRIDSLEALVSRLGVIPIFLWPTAPPVAGTGNLHALPPPMGSFNIAVSATDASTPANSGFNKGDSPMQHVFTAAGVQVMTALYGGNSNAKGRARVTI